MRDFVRRRWMQTVLILALPSMMTAACKKKNIEPDDVDVVMVQDVEASLSVVAIDPSRVPASETAAAVVRGAGFERGAQVYVGPTRLETVDYLDANSLRVQVPALPVGRYDIEVVNPDGASSLLRQGLTVESQVLTCESATVYFDLDSDDLSSGSKQNLASNLECYRSYTSTIRVEGHCDERGTTDYNLALGNRRAEAVGSYLVQQGLPTGRVKRVSYGEERPAVNGSTEAAWAQNRRAEVVISK